jgi:hypothetical protein
VGQEVDPIITIEPNNMICLDVLGPLPYTEGKKRYCIVAVDHLVKISILIPIILVNRQTIYEFLITIVGHLGLNRHA